MPIPRRHAFSLIELLVVIAIIGVVLSLLLPALTGAMARARELKCLAGMQQMAEAFNVYAGDHKSWLPQMPVPSGLAPLDNQHMYGGLAGLFSLQQTGDGTHTGFSPATPGAYANGHDIPLMAPYLTSLGALTCPVDREDRWYGFPYAHSPALSYAAATPIRPSSCNRQQDVAAYNISYLYPIGLKLSGRTPHRLWADETNGPDLPGYAWYGDGSGNWTATPNSTAAGATSAGFYAPVDNHREGGGNVAYDDGSARFQRGAAFSPATPVID